MNIEAYSIEDNGVLHFNVYVYNVQDGIVIDYATGESKYADSYNSKQYSFSPSLKSPI